VHVARLRLRSFRNYTRLDVDFEPGVHLLIGPNAQGKTNLLEAIYLLATLRSFRGAPTSELVQYGQNGFFVGAEIVSVSHYSVRYFWSREQRRLTVNGEVIRRASDYFGILRAVVFCTEDIFLVKGPAGIRRRFLDLLLAQTHPEYLVYRQRYAEAVRARNALLRSEQLDSTALAGFTEEMVRYGSRILQARAELVKTLRPLIQRAYAGLSEAEKVDLAYRPGVKEDFRSELEAALERDRRDGVTHVGPHRDDVLLLLDGKPAARFGSEGQKRSLSIALRIAQVEYLTEVHGVPPVLLLDDIMGELDPNRRAGIGRLLDRCLQERGQAFLTTTEDRWSNILAEKAIRWRVKGGTLLRAELDQTL